MKSIKILLGSANRTLNNLIEANLRDLCFERAHVELTCVPRIGEFMKQACYDAFDLVIVAPWDLQTDMTRAAVPVDLEQICCGLKIIRKHHDKPVLAVSVGVNDEEPLLDAGADSVVFRPLNPVDLRKEVELAARLPLPLAEDPKASTRWSIGGWLRNPVLSSKS